MHVLSLRRNKKHTTAGIRWSSPTQLLVRPSLACLWESGRDPEFSTVGMVVCAGRCPCWAYVHLDAGSVTTLIHYAYQAEHM